MNNLITKKNNSLQLIEQNENNTEVICSKDADTARTRLKYIGAINEKEYVYKEELGAKDIYIVDSITTETLYTFHYDTIDIFQCVIDKKKENLIITGYDISRKPSVNYLGIVNLETKQTNFTETKGFVSSHDIKLSEDERYFYYTGVALDENDKKQLISTVYRYDIQAKTEKEVVYVFRNKVINTLSLSPDGKYIYVHNGMNMTKIATDTSVRIDNVFWPYSQSVINMYSKYFDQNDVLVTSCSDNYINAFDVKTNRQVIYLNMLDILEYNNVAERKMLEELHFGVKPDVYINADMKYLCLLYVVNSRGIAYADIFDIDSKSVIKRISSKKFHWISKDFLDDIKSYGYTDDAIYAIEHSYRALVLLANNLDMDSQQISYSQDKNIITITGKDLDYRYTLYQIDLNKLSFSSPLYFKKTTALRSYCYSDHILLHRVGYDENEILKLDYKDSEIIGKQNTNIKLYNGFNEKYTAEAIEENTQIKIKDNKGNTIKVIPNDDNNQNSDYTWAWSNNGNVLYTKGRVNSVKRWEIDKLNNHDYTPDEYDISHINEYTKVGSVINESTDGRYIALKGKKYLIDSKNKVEIGEFEEDVLPLSSIFIHDALTFLLKGNYRRNVWVASANNKMLVEVTLLSGGRIVMRTRSEKLAKDGWIYTNCEDALNIYIKYNDGNTRLLNPGDSQRNKYLSQYQRKDFVRNIILDHDRYIEQIRQLELIKKKQYFIETEKRRQLSQNENLYLE